MSFVHVILSDLKAQCIKHPYSPYSKYYFLLEPVTLIASVEKVRNPAVLQFVSFNASIEKNYGHAASCKAFIGIKPGSDFNISVLNFYAYFFC